MTYRVIVHLHPWAESPLQDHSLEEALTIGRNGSNRLVVRDDRVSKEHGRLFQRDERLWYRDMDSRNGTQLGTYTIRNSTVEVTKDDVLKIGGLSLRIVKFYDLK